MGVQRRYMFHPEIRPNSRYINQQKINQRENIFSKPRNAKTSQQRVHSQENYVIRPVSNTRKVTGNEGYLKNTKIQRIREHELVNKPPKEKVIPFKPGGKQFPEIF